MVNIRLLCFLLPRLLGNAKTCVEQQAVVEEKERLSGDLSLQTVFEALVVLGRTSRCLNQEVMVDLLQPAVKFGGFKFRGSGVNVESC